MTSALDEKWRLFNFFSVHGTDGSPKGPDPEDRVGDQDAGSPGYYFIIGIQPLGQFGQRPEFSQSTV